MDGDAIVALGHVYAAAYRAHIRRMPSRPHDDSSTVHENARVHARAAGRDFAKLLEEIYEATAKQG